MPSSPPLTQFNSLAPDVFCNESKVSNCTDGFCECTYTLEIPLGSLVELIVLDEGWYSVPFGFPFYMVRDIIDYVGVTFNASHLFHLHGYSFRVVAMERVASSVTVDQIRAMNENGLIRRNLLDAPIKDTVAIPDGGYTIIRFLATNPGRSVRLFYYL